MMRIGAGVMGGRGVVYSLPAFQAITVSDASQLTDNTPTDEALFNPELERTMTINAPAANQINYLESVEGEVTGNGEAPPGGHSSTGHLRSQVADLDAGTFVTVAQHNTHALTQCMSGPWGTGTRVVHQPKRTAISVGFHLSYSKTALASCTALCLRNTVLRGRRGTYPRYLG